MFRPMGLFWHLGVTCEVSREVSRQTPKVSCHTWHIPSPPPQNRIRGYMGGQNLYTNAARRDPPQTPGRLFGVYVVSFFSLENKLFGIHQTSCLPVEALEFSELKTPLVYTFLPPSIALSLASRSSCVLSCFALLERPGLIPPNLQRIEEDRDSLSGFQLQLPIDKYYNRSCNYSLTNRVMVVLLRLSCPSRS